MQSVFDHFMNRFGAARERRKQLEQEPEYVESVLMRGVEQARKVALPLVREVRDAVGIPNP